MPLVLSSIGTSAHVVPAELRLPNASIAWTLNRYEWPCVPVNGSDFAVVSALSVVYVTPPHVVVLCRSPTDTAKCVDALLHATLNDAVFDTDETVPICVTTGTAAGTTECTADGAADALLLPSMA